MASLIQAWRRMMDLPEKTVRSDRRTAAGKKTGSHIQKTSAERAVERLAEKTGTPNSVLQHQAAEVVPEQGNRSEDGTEELQEAKLQTATAKEMIFTSEEIKKIVEEALNEANDTEEMKEYLAQRFSILEGQIMSVRNVQKQEMIAVSVREVQEKVDLIRFDTRKTGNIRIMLGVSIGCNLITLAVLAAYVLHFI